MTITREYNNIKKAIITAEERGTGITGVVGYETESGEFVIDVGIYDEFSCYLVKRECFKVADPYLLDYLDDLFGKMINRIKYLERHYDGKPDVVEVQE